MQNLVRLLITAALIAGTQGVVHAQLDYHLRNASTDFTFRPSGNDLHLLRIDSSSGASVLFDPLPLWKLELRNTDLSAGNQFDPGDAVEVLPSDLVGVFPFGGSGPSMTAEWTGSVQIQGIPVLLSVRIDWVLVGDTAKATIHTTIQNPAATDYRIWLHRFPRLRVQDIDPNNDGSSSFASGRLGGYLYGDPIHYFDAFATESFCFTSSEDHDHGGGGPYVSNDSRAPGRIAVPVNAYYDEGTGDCLYIANDDFGGYGKGIYWFPEPGTDSFRYETVQLQDGDIYGGTTYDSPYAIHIAAIKGDWITAAHKYRKVFSNRDGDSSNTNPWYKGPIGLTSNDAVHDEMKTNPLFVWLTPEQSSGGRVDPYCPTGGTGGAGFLDTDAVARTTAHWEFIRDWFDDAPVPYVLVNRIGFDPAVEFAVDHGGTLACGTIYDPYEKKGTTIQTLMSNMEAGGHRVALHSITEKASVGTQKRPVVGT